MVDRTFEFTPVEPLDGIAELPRSDQIELSVVNGLTFAQVFAKSGQRDELCQRLGIKAQPGRATVLPEFTALPLSPGQWMLVSADEAIKDSFAGSIADRIEGFGYVSPQSDSRVCIRLSGPRARTVMAKGCRLDLHPRVAHTGFCAQTVMAQVGVMLHQIDDIPTYDILVYAGFARSFRDWIVDAAAEFAV